MLINPNKIISALAPWNAWEAPSPFAGIRRDITAQLFPFIDRPEALVLTGMRRSGKSTIMYQLIEDLVASGVDRHATLMVNFDEPALGSNLGNELLESIYLGFRKKLCPTGRVYLFLDEIQHVPG